MILRLSRQCVTQVPSRAQIVSQDAGKRLNSPLTSSCGRLSDAVAVLLALRGRVSYEGQAAIELEALAESVEIATVYPYEIMENEACLVPDFRQMISSIVQDMASARPVAEIARCFHNTMAAATAELCGLIRKETGIERVVLSGGVFRTNC
jgi:hydrogenase maturation protein HypF